jgi:endonuclease YncB( thermonuclease family)
MSATYACVRKAGMIAVLTALGCASAPASELAGPYQAVVDRVIDGDTIRVRAAVWLDQEIEISVRVEGVDAPELFRPKCEAEKALAQRARAFVAEFLSDGTATLVGVRHDKYAGRVVARVLSSSGGDLGPALIAAGLADADPDRDWCAPVS